MYMTGPSKSGKSITQTQYNINPDHVVVSKKEELPKEISSITIGLDGVNRLTLSWSEIEFFAALYHQHKWW